MKSKPLHFVAVTNVTEMEANRRASETGIEEMEPSELNTDGLEDGILDFGGMLKSVSDFEYYEECIRIRTKANEELNDSVLQKYIVEDSKLFASVYNKLKTAYNDEGWIDKLSEMSSKCEENPELAKHFSDWYKSRKALIKITKSAAKELDQTLFIVNITRIISSLFEVLNILNLGIYQIFHHNITSYAYNISPQLGFITESALEYAPYLRFMGFVSSFFEILRSQEIINNVVDAIRNDESNCLQIKEWLEKTKELDIIVKKKFPYRINKKVTKIVENALEDFGKEEKIFSATVVSNLMEDPTIHKNETFMVEAFLFSMSDDAKEWYKRMIKVPNPLELECGMSDLQKKSLHLERTYSDSASKLEFGKRTVDQMEYIITKNIGSNFGQCIICSLSGLSIYYSLRNIRTGARHRYSDKLRELSKSAQSFLNSMEKIRI